MVNVNRKVYIERYWAQVFSSLREEQQIAKSENPEFALAWERIRQFLNDCFVETAQLYIIERWEKIVGINPRPGDSLEQRRYRILNMMQSNVPYSELALKHIYLANIVGEGNYEVTVDPVSCTIEVLLSPANQEQWADVAGMLDAILPANMALAMGYLGTPHSVVEQYTHDELAAYSHDEIRGKLRFINQQ